MKIMLDLDGVVADFNDAAVARFGPGDTSLYNLSLRWPDQAEAVREFVLAPQTYLELPHIPGALWGWNALRTAGHEIVVCTSRPDHCEQATQAWLAQLGLKYDELVFVPWTAHKLKGEVLAGHGIHLAIEDAIEQADGLLKEGIPVLLVEQPWNSNGRYRHLLARDWIEVVRQVLWFDRHVAYDPEVHARFTQIYQGHL